MLNKKILILLCGILIAGCSATSSRYNRRSESPERNNNLRYSQNTETDTSSAEQFYEDNDEEMEPAPDDEAIDIGEVMNRFGASKNNEQISLDQSTSRERTLMEIIKYLNTPYKYGGNSKKGIDCSAFTQTIYTNALSLSLLRSAREQYTQGISVDKSELQFGDLVFFNTRRRVRPGHVGIYIGDNLFAHASSKHGVIVSSLDHQYYTRTYMGARRMDNSLFTN
jgi:cell wall-associated NlpC family hydrolase